MGKYNGNINPKIDLQSDIEGKLNANRQPPLKTQNYSSKKIHQLTENKNTLIDMAHHMNGGGKKKKTKGKIRRKTTKGKRRRKTTKGKRKRKTTKGNRRRKITKGRRRRKTIKSRRKQKGGKGIKLEVTEIESAPTVRGPINELTKQMVKLNAKQIQNANASSLNEPTDSVIRRFV